MFQVSYFEGIYLQRVRFDCVTSAMNYARSLGDEYKTVSHKGNNLELGKEYVCGICLSYGEACNDTTLNELELD